MRKPRLAVIATVWFPFSHADVIVRRWLEPNPERDRPWGFDGTRSEIASVYLEQLPTDDVGVTACARASVPVFRTLDDALTCGGSALAVDGVLLIGEHGTYPTNALGQKLYPRKELFDAIVAVLERSGRVVPLFCDKHFSWNGAWAHAMWQTVQDKRIPWLAGSSTPLVGFRHRAHGKVTPPQGVHLREGLTIFNGGPEIYGFHALEVAQAALERRPGGECGVVDVLALAGDAVPAAVADGTIPVDLLQAALDAEGKPLDGAWERIKTRGVDPEYSPIVPTAFRVTHSDGLVMWHLCMNGHIDDISLALRTDDGIWAGSADLGGPDAFYPHFATLSGQIETLMVTGTCAVPPERTYLTTLTIAHCMEALATPGQPRTVADAAIRYAP